MKKQMLVLLLVTATGCGSETTVQGSGSATILLESESTIANGLDPGAEVEDIQDGWQVRFDRYVVAIGDVGVHLSTDESVEAEAHELFAVDLKAVPSSGLPLWELTGLPAGRWNLGYRVGGAGDGATRHGSVAQADFDEMAAGDHSYLVEGTLTQAAGQSCPPATLAVPPTGASPNGANAGGDDCYDNPSVSFRLLVPAETAYGPCEIDEVPGFSVAADSNTTVAVTIHGDHLFFNGFPEGGEGGIVRLAQWLADCDLDLDGEVTREELESIAPSDLPELDDRYQLGGSPITPLADMWDYVIAQLKTQGHFQGEGECPVDGVAHEHDD